MKILLVHNFYGSSSPSGENQVVDIEKQLLVSHGHDTETFYRNSDEILRKGVLGKLLGGISTPWNFLSARAIKKQIEKYRPDVVHVHNTFPLISPSIFRAIGKSAARVLTLHNYRLFCPAAIPMRGGIVCTQCLDSRNVWPSIRNGCYRRSRLATIPLAVNVALHRQIGTWANDVDAFVALTDFQRSVMVSAGLPEGKIFVKPNFFPGNPVPIPWEKRDECVVFAGRLSPEKGITTLIKAWTLWGAEAPELRIIGGGELGGKVAALSEGANIRLLGQLPPVEAQSQIANSKMLVLPSECFEGFPMVIREAFAFGTPVAVSDLGPLPSLVTNGVNGVVFKPANPESLLKVVKGAWMEQICLKRMSEEARKAFEELYSEKTNLNSLLEIYRKAIARNKS